MPQNSTLSLGAMTSRSFFPRAAASSSTLGGPDEIAAGLLVRLELDEALVLRFFEKVRERLEPVIRLVETRLPPLECLLHHRAPDFFPFAALGNERVQGLDDQVERLLLLVLCRGGTFAPLLRSTALLLVLPHEVVVIDELVAVGDEEIRARILDTHTDHRLRVFAQL